MKEELNEFTGDLQHEDITRTGEGKALPSTRPPWRTSEGSHEPPLSNRLISHRANAKRGAKDTGGCLEIYPSMAVRKRNRSETEDEYYALLARFGKKSRESGSRRGQIDHFSNSARFRMLQKLGSIGREDPPHMVTLTYRAGTVTHRQAKKDIDKWSKRMNRMFGIRHESTEEYQDKQGFSKLRKRYTYEGTWAGAWRFEVTTGDGKRALGKTPHFHVLVWCEKWHQMNMDELDHMLSEMWCQITGDGGEDRMKYGCRIDYSGGDQTKIKNYMLGHHGKKTDQEALNAGRHWGIFNEKLLRVGQPTAVVQLDPKQRHKLDRILSKLIASRIDREEQDLSDLNHIHAVLGPHNARRLLQFLELS